MREVYNIRSDPTEVDEIISIDFKGFWVLHDREVFSQPALPVQVPVILHVGRQDLGSSPTGRQFTVDSCTTKAPSITGCLLPRPEHAVTFLTNETSHNMVHYKADSSELTCEHVLNIWEIFCKWILQQCLISCDRNLLYNRRCLDLVYCQTADVPPYFKIGWTTLWNCLCRLEKQSRKLVSDTYVDGLTLTIP